MSGVIRMLPRGSRAFSVLLLFMLLLVSACEGTPDSRNTAGNSGSDAVSAMENTKADAVPKPVSTKEINAAAAGREGQTAFVHRAESGNINANSTYVDDPTINGDPEAQLLITRNWNPGGEGGTYNDHPVGVWYDSEAERWAIYNEDRETMPEGVAFNVAISKADQKSSEEVASSDTNEATQSNAETGKKPEKPADGTETDDLPEGIPEYQDFYAKGNPETQTDLISGNSSVGTIPPVKPFNFGRDPGGPKDKTLYLTIPALEIEGIPVFDTLSEEKLRDGAVHIPATGYPWQDGANVFIAGHRIGYPNTLSYYVFYRLDQLAEGDEILLQNSSGREFKYRVTEQKVVGPENVAVMNAVEGRSLISLQTCTLPDYEERIIVQGELVEKNT
ncbi:MAG: sortase [Rubrobacter sp.]|nr:sortase [Rubrobacter sp.]